MAVRSRKAGDGIGTRVPVWYWVVAVLALLWAVTGCISYYDQVTMSPAELAALPELQRELWSETPAWVLAAYAVAVWMMLVGTAGLLLRRGWAVTAFAVSLVAALAQFGWALLLSPLLRTVGPVGAALPLFIVAAGIALLRFAVVARRRSWLR